MVSLRPATKSVTDSIRDSTPPMPHENIGQLPTANRRLFLLASAVIVLLAGSLRVYHLAQRSLWLDEAIAANISRGTLSQTLILTRGFHSAPIVDPLILNGVEKVGNGPLAVRMPSFIASVLAVVLMLCFVTIPLIDYKTAALSAVMLSVSAAQIRYAQEVREYSLSVLSAGILLYVYLSYLAKKDEEKSPWPLYVALFFAPLIQYGLVLFSAGVLSALVILALAAEQRGRRIAQVFAASGFLALGGLLSFLLTLRYQWGDDAWYLKDSILSPGSGLVRFVSMNTYHLITFLLPGLLAASISVVAIVIYLVTSIRGRLAAPPVAVLAFTSCGIVLLAAILRAYPYGGIRQCLFLAPVLCLFASKALIRVTDRFAGRANALIFTAIVGIVVVSGVRQIRLLKPYAEIEDIQPVLRTLQAQIKTGDAVYVYSSAVFAVDFYMKERDPRFIFGDYHRKDPQKYVTEIQNGVGARSDRLWIVMSHVYRDEDQRILHDLSTDWNIEPVISVTGSSLYLATRRPGAAVEASDRAPVTDQTHDSFWDWNIRNARETVR